HSHARARRRSICNPAIHWSLIKTLCLLRNHLLVLIIGLLIRIERLRVRALRRLLGLCIRICVRRLHLLLGLGLRLWVRRNKGLPLRPLLGASLRTRPAVSLRRVFAHAHTRNRIRPAPEISEMLNFWPGDFTPSRKGIIIVLAHLGLGQDGVAQLNLLPAWIICRHTIAF